MVIAILADREQKEALLTQPVPSSTEVIWADSIRSLSIIEADAFIDLLFEKDAERVAHLKKLLPKPVVVAEVIDTSAQIGADFIRINAWPGMLERALTEIAVPAGMDEDKVTAVFEKLNRKCQMVPDIAGMVTPRILAMIINEAFYAESEGISSRQGIDTAMKLGTNYPLGPFEWADRIGVDRITALLDALSLTDSRYSPAPSLVNMVSKQSPTFRF